MLKITILRNKTVDNSSIDQGIVLVKNAFNSINLPFDLKVRDINVNFTGMPFNNTTIGNGNCVKPEEILAQVDGKDDIAFLIFNNNDVLPQPLNPVQSPVKKGYTTPCQMCEQWYNKFPEVFASYFLHEVCHAMYFLLNKVNEDVTHYQYLNPTYSQKPNIDYYLYLITTLTPAWNAYQHAIPPTQKYKYFKDSEVVGLKPEFVQLLDKMRGECGFPFIISSGYRSQAQNASLSDAVSDSAHLSGLAVDLSIKDSVRRFKLIKVAFANGINRIGIGQNFIHLDISKTLPSEVAWMYN